MPDYLKIKFFTKEEETKVLNSCDLIIEESHDINTREELKNIILNKHLDKNIYINGNGSIRVCTKDELFKLERMFKIKETKKYMKDIYNQLNSQISVSVHIRSGDFITDDNEYYLAAVEYVKELYPEAVFYFFSVETSMEDVKKLFGFDNNYHFVRFSGGYQETIDELSCIIACKIHILSTESSFSQFGAWQDNKEGKLVILSSKTKRDYFKIIDEKSIVLDDDTIYLLSERDKNNHNVQKFEYDKLFIEKQIITLKQNISEDILKSREIISYLFSNAELYDEDIWLELLFIMGEIYYNEEQFAISEIIYEKCIMYNKVNEQVLNSLLKCYEKQELSVNKSNLVKYIKKADFILLL